MVKLRLLRTSQVDSMREKKKYYRKKKQEQALLDLTPTSSLSETENSFGNEENNRQELDTNNESLNRTPAQERFRPERAN